MTKISQGEKRNQHTGRCGTTRTAHAFLLFFSVARTRPAHDRASAFDGGGGHIAHGGGTGLLVVAPGRPSPRHPGAAAVVEPPELRGDVRALALRRGPLLPGVDHPGPPQRRRRRLNKPPLLQPILPQELPTRRDAGVAQRQDLLRQWPTPDTLPERGG